MLDISKQDVSFPSYPYFTQPIPEYILETMPLDYFDKDGYEVPNKLERIYYDLEGITLNNKIQYHIAPVKQWYIDNNKTEQGFILDHAMILYRYGFAQGAREQLERVAAKRPILQKLLNIKPKWGIDFSLDYVDRNGVLEVIHIEQDFYNVNDAINAKKKLERIVEVTEWTTAVTNLRLMKDKWMHLSSDDQSDYKAQFFGWHRAFDNRKVI